VSPGPRTITIQPDRLVVCRLDPDAPLPAWLFHAESHFLSLTRTREETSIVCPEDDLPPSLTRVERGWRALKLEGPIPFDETGVLVGLASPLATAGIPLFALSTFDTDYLLVRERDLARAREALSAHYRLRDA
jgi:hypothetical protein